MYHSLLKSFPNFIKPSYETIMHKNVSELYDIAVAIPFGKRCFLWFTVFKSKNICCIIELSRNQTLQDNVHIIDIEFPLEFSLGTVLSGYLIDGDETIPDRKIFLADELFMFKGYEFGNPFPIPLAKKIKPFIDFFQELPCNMDSTYSIHSLVIWKHTENGIPLYWKENVGYPTKCIQYRTTTKVAPYMNFMVSKNVWNQPPNIEEEDVKPKNSIWSKQISNMPTYTLDFKSPAYRGKKLFWIEAEQSFDVYHMYAQKNKLYQYVFIPDMKTSKMMNSHFRCIPENDCLDKVEESDDEEDFENIDENKYMQGKKRLLMECVFNRKFKKWVPLYVKPNHLGKYVPHLDDLIVLNRRFKKM